MNQKTLKQIEEMKQQTIGVEIEMNNITRKEAAEVVAKHFGTEAIIQQAFMDIPVGLAKTIKEEFGNFKKMLALQEMTITNAKW